MEESQQNNGTPQSSEEALARCQQQCEEYLNGWKRAKADLINYKREEQERFSAVTKFAQQSLIEDLLIVLDSFTLALASATDKNDQTGITLIKSQMEDILKRYGVEPISVALGDSFDSHIHEGVGENAGPPELEGKVTEIVSAGYRLHTKVIRPAKVKIGRGQA